MKAESFPDHKSKSGWAGAFLMLLWLVLFNFGCAKDPDTTLDTPNGPNNPNPTDQVTDRAATGYEQVNIVSDVATYNPQVLDPNLINAWGLALSPSQDFWVTSAHADLTVVYNHQGQSVKPPLEIEGDPIGIVYNTSSSFKMPGSTNIARFLFATEEGKIAAWTPWHPNEIVTILDNSSKGAGYTGLEIAKSGGNYFLYAANVDNGTVDVYDRDFHAVSNMPFLDPSLPTGAKPFNIRLINGKLYVTYVGPGGGFVNVFNTNGSFVKRFASGGTLAAPWGITSAPTSFGLGSDILVGNFGSGYINIYSNTGQYKGQLSDKFGSPIHIDGLWALVFTGAAMDGNAEAELYFTAGPDDEEHGLFGYLEKEE